MTATNSRAIPKMIDFHPERKIVFIWNHKIYTRGNVPSSFLGFILRMVKDYELFKLEIEGDEMEVTLEYGFGVWTAKVPDRYEGDNLWSNWGFTRASALHGLVERISESILSRE